MEISPIMKGAIRAFYYKIPFMCEIFISPCLFII